MSDEPGAGEAARKLSESVARILEGATSLATSVAETAADALRSEQRRYVVLACCAGALFLLLGLAGLFAGMAVILAFHAAAPAWAATGVAGSFLLLAGATAWYMSKVLRQRPPAIVRLASLAGVFAHYLRARR